MNELLPWILFNLFILVMLVLDLFVFHKEARKVDIREAILWSIFWVSLSLIFNLYIYYARGQEQALAFLTGYIIEKSLSVDNLFVFLLIFNYFKTPASSLHKVLFWGVFSAILMRALFIWLGIGLINQFHWIIYIFGLFLIFTGIKLGFQKDQKIDPEKNIILRLVRRIIPITKDYVDNKFFVLKNAKYFATPLFLVLIAIETTDLIFAFDSIPAILAITREPFIVYTSNIFAILGLRSLYFVLAHAMGLFHYLHYALAFILTFIGFKMLISEFFKIPVGFALGIVFMALFLSVVTSVLFSDTIKMNKG
ncbi:MAG TPA: TerC family protein [Parachlamydiaceae bacterium]|nr:TerC family protein [Parachlamydiaceae bacterium]